MAVTFDEKYAKPWLVEYRHAWTGKRIRKRFTLEDAAQEFDRAQEEQREQERTLLKKKRRTERGETNITVKELFNRYFKLVGDNEITLRTEKYHVTPIVGAFGGRIVTLLTQEDILNFILIQKLRGLKQSTISTRLRIFRRAVSWGKKAGLLKSNPFADLVLPIKSKSKRIAPPSPKEAEALLTLAPPHVQRVIALGWHTGARIGPSELFALTWADVDLEYGIVRMPSAKKNKTTADARDIPISSFLLPIIKKWQEHDLARGIEYVIHWRGKAVKSIGKSWRRCLRLAKETLNNLQFQRLLFFGKSVFQKLVQM